MRIGWWTRPLQRALGSIARAGLKQGAQAVADAWKPAVKPRVKRTAPQPLPRPDARNRLRQPARAPDRVPGEWVSGLVAGAAGIRRFRLYRPPGIVLGEQLPLVVMLHGCGQTADGFAASTRMHRIAARERFLVLYPEQDRLANSKGCWNWFDTDTGRAYGECRLILQSIDQVCLLHGGDRGRVAVMGLSAGASMAGLLATRHPGRFRAVVMHSGIPPGAAHSAWSALGAMQGRRAAPSPGAVPRAKHWPPLLVIQGDYDAVVAPANGEAAAQAWATAAHATAGPPRRVQRGKRLAMTVTDFTCGERRVAMQLLVAGLGHAWSGGAASQPFGDARGPDASRLAWAFVWREFVDSARP